MKLKATATRTVPNSLKEALDSSRAADIFQTLIVRHLHVPEDQVGPATHYVQDTDYTIPDNKGMLGVTVVISQVSVNRYRSAQDFADLLSALETEYTALIQRNVPSGSQVQLFCVIALDEHVEGLDGRPTRLLETEAVWVKGTQALFQTKSI